MVLALYPESRRTMSSSSLPDTVKAAKAAGIKHGVVQDKLFLPGLRKLDLSHNRLGR